MNWFRFYTNSLDNPKIQKLPAELFKAWVNILCLARLNSGSVPSLADLAFRLRVSEAEASHILDDLLSRRLLDQTSAGLRPHDWEEHQYLSDSSTERSRKSRQKARNVARNRTATLQQRPRTEQSRTDKNVSPIGDTVKTPTKTSPEDQNLTTASELLVRFPGAEGLPGEPDDIILGKCLALAENSPERLGDALRRIWLAGKKPATSWAWFPVVLEQYLKRPAGRERRRA